MRKYPVIQLDVFASRPLEGNQLAVFPDARGLADEEMQALARETNLSETTFIVPRDIATERERGVQVRIFTTQEELPFAGHPTLGTAFALHGADRRAVGALRAHAHDAVVQLDLKVGKIPVSFSERDGLLFGEMTQRDPSFGHVHSPEEVARATGLEVSDLDASLPVQTVSTGIAFAIVPLRSLKVIGGLGFSFRQLAAYLDRTDAKFAYFVTREVVDPGAALHARMIFYNGEDPATGSAAGCCAAWAVRHGVVASDQQALIEQGLEIKRPSRIFIRATRSGDRVVNVRVGGHCVEVLRGEVTI